MSSTGNMRLAFVVQMIDRATAPLRQVEGALARVVNPILRVQQKFAAFGQDYRVVGSTYAVINTARPFARWGQTAVGALMGAAAAGGAAAFALNGVTSRVAGIADQAIKLSMTTEEFTRLTFAAQQSGASAEAMSTGLQMLYVKMSEATTGSKEAALGFERVGITVKELQSGMSAADVVARIADKFAQVGDQGQNAQRKIEWLREMMGRGGADLKQLFDGGADGLRALGKESDRLGNTLSGKTAAAMKAYDDNVNALHASVAGLGVKITAAALPALERLVARLAEMSVAAQSEWADKLGQRIGSVVDTIPRLLEGLGALAQYVSRVATVVDNVVGRIGGWNTVLAVLVGVVTGTALYAVYAFTAAVVGLGIAMWATPIGAVILGFSALATAAVAVLAYWEPIAEFFEKLWTIVKGVVAAFGSLTNMPKAGTPSIYASADEWKRYRAAQPTSAGLKAVAGGGAVDVSGKVQIELKGGEGARISQVTSSGNAPLSFAAYAGIPGL